MWQKLPLALLTLLSLTACETANSSAGRFAGVPLVEYTKADQAKVSAKIDAACGVPARCPVDAILEQWVLDYGKLRAMVRAAVPAH